MEQTHIEQNMTRLSKVVKEAYLPAFKNGLGTEPSALLGKIKKVALTSQKIVAAAPFGLSGGFGFGQEGQPTPIAGNINYERFEVSPKDMYVNLAISQKAIKLASGAGSIVDALDAEIKGAYDTAKWNVGRALFGNGSGVLANVDAQSEASATITVDSVKNIKEGLFVDVYATGGSTPVLSTKRVVSVNRTADSSGKYTVTIDSAPTTKLAAGFITVQGSYNREITGLNAIYDDSITSLYGVSKSANQAIKPIKVTAPSGNITDSLITNVLRRARNEKGSEIDTILCGDTAYDEYVDYLRSNNYRVETATRELEGGFQSIVFKFGNKVVDIVNESFVPADKMWGVDSTMLELHSMDWFFSEVNGSGIFNLMESTSVYRALLVSYGDLICKHPGGCVEINGIAA
jgi:hypothetical protein